MSAAKDICNMIAGNNDAIRNGTSAGQTAIINISTAVRKAIDNPNPKAPGELFDMAKKSIEDYMETHFGAPLRANQSNGRTLFNFAAEFNRSLTSIERAVRFSFISLDNSYSKKVGVLLLADVPYASLRQTFLQLQAALYESLIARMNEMRDGDALSRDAIKSVVELIRKINFQIDKTTHSTAAENKFTSEYCKSVQIYYMVKGGEKLASSENVVAYANWAGTRINEERALLSELNMAKEWTNLKESLHTSLVRESFISVVHEPNGGLAKELDQERDVSALFALLELVSTNADPLEGVKEVGKSYQAYVERRAQAILTAPAPPPEEVPAGQKPKPPPDTDSLNYKEFMKFVTHHLLDVWPNQFKKNVVVIQYFDNGLRTVLKGKDKVPRLHSDHMDAHFRNLKDDDLTDEVTGTIFVFKKIFESIPQKDEFLPNYKARLSRRIIRPGFRRSIETRMLVELKAVVGNADIHSMSSMVTDVDGSATLTKTFAETNGKEHKIKANFILITRQYWPTFDLFSVKLEKTPLEAVIQDFQKYYSGRYHNRKIDWVTQLSSATVNVAFTGGPKELSGSLIQGLILLAIDGTKGLTAGDVAAQLGINSTIVRDNLASISLSKINVAKMVDPESFAPSTSKIIKDTTPAFAINDTFKCPVRKLELPLPTSSKGKVVEADTATIENNRKLRAQIAVIRFMKSRGTSLYQEMADSVLRDLRNTFDAQPSLVKSTLDELIDKEYVKRDPNDRTKLIYIA